MSAVSRLSAFLSDSSTLFAIDDDQFFPAGVVRESDAHDVIVAGVAAPGYSPASGYSEHFELHAFQFLEGQILEQRASSCGEVMLNRIGEREKIATGVFESVAKRNQFLPAIDGDEPAIFQIAAQFFRLDAKIDNIGVCPDKRMKRLDVGNGRPICFPPMHTHGAAFAQLNGDNPRRQVRAEEQRVFLEFHSHKTAVIPSEVEESRGDTFGKSAGSLDYASLRSG